MKNDYPLTPEEFNYIYSTVPRLTVEILIKNEEGILLTKRAIQPCQGQWHLPGGTVKFGEPLVSAVKRIAKRELGIEVTQAINVGIIEYPSHYLHGLDSPVGIVFKCSVKGDMKQNNESLTYGWFKKIPSPMHADQDKYLLDMGYLKS